MDLPPIYVLRHGETEWNAAGRWQGATNSPLTALGHDQADRQGHLLADLDLLSFDIFVSPQGRAFQTAAIALGRRVPFLRTDDRLREIEVGAWTGLLRDEMVVVPGPVTEDTPDGRLSIYEYAPEGEGFTALRRRCESFLGDLKRPSICVTHGITSLMLRALALGLPPARMDELPGGQGVIHIVEDGQHRTLSQGVA